MLQLFKPPALTPSNFLCLSTSTFTVADTVLVQDQILYGVSFPSLHTDFKRSNSATDPARLILQSIRIRQPIIVVNINYRLNIFGFAASTELLTLHERNRGCNFGLMDQATALRWVSANIAAFGGDANKITLGGQSAGATSVYSHALRALDTDEQPMFRSCIIQSPAAGVLGPFDMERADQKWSRLCSHLGLSNLSTRKRLSLLRSLPTDELLKAVGDLGWATFTLVADEITLSTRMYDMERDQRCGDGQSTEALAASIKRNPIPFNVLLGTTSCEVCQHFSVLTPADWIP